MGATHFLTKGLEHVKTEMSLHVLAYNFKRLIAILGIANMLNAVRAYARFLSLQSLLWSIALVLLMENQRQRYGASKRFLTLQN
jgi:transposase